MPSDAASSFCLAGSCGTNSCSGGSSKRIVTGRPSIASSVPLMLVLTNGNNSASAALRSSTVLLRIIFRSRNSGSSEPVAVEHVLGAEQADAFGAELAGDLGVVGRVGVGAHAQRAELVDQLHEALEARVLGGVHHLQRAGVDRALGAVERDHVAFLELHVADR